MITTHSLQTLLSTHLWLDHTLQQKGQAYLNTTSQFFYQPDPALDPSYVAYAAPFRSFVCDSGVSGATVMTTISGSIGTLSRGQSGMMIDYENGRVLLPASFGTNAVISGSYSVKELNVYKTNESQEQIVFGNKYYLNSRFARPITGLPPPNAMVTPAVFISNRMMQNTPAAFGGTYETTNEISLTVLAERLDQLEGVLSLMADSLHVCFPQLPMSQWPLNEYGDLKSGYNYETVKQQYAGAEYLYTITDVDTSTVSDAEKINQGLFVGLVNLSVSKHRAIH